MDELLEDEELRKQKAMLAKVAEELKYDLSVVLTNKIDFTRCCYTHDIQLVDNIRGKKFEGLTFYMKNCGLLKIVTHLKFAYNRLNIDSVTVDIESSTIRVGWRITGMGLTRLAIRYIPDKMWSRENIDKASPVWLEGVSTYHVNTQGKVYKHVIDQATSSGLPHL